MAEATNVRTMVRAAAVDPLDDDLRAACLAVSTTMISDNLSRLPGPVGLRMLHDGTPLVGVALTVRVRSGDNLAIHRALEMVEPGQVLVIDGGGDTGRALVGEIMMTICASRGGVGFVVDGAVRDSAAFAASGFGCYARSVIHRGPYKAGPGEIGAPVSVGGTIVSTGDIVVGDADGVVSFPRSGAHALLAAASRQKAEEAEILRLIRAGRYDGRYAKSSH